MSRSAHAPPTKRARDRPRHRERIVKTLPDLFFDAQWQLRHAVARTVCFLVGHDWVENEPHVDYRCHRCGEVST